MLHTTPRGPCPSSDSETAACNALLLLLLHAARLCHQPASLTDSTVPFSTPNATTASLCRQTAKRRQDEGPWEKTTTETPPSIPGIDPLSASDRHDPPSTAKRGKGNHHDTKPRVWPGDIDDGPRFSKLSRPATD